jgi:lysophospholipase L1-like esterase
MRGWGGGRGLNEGRVRALGLLGGALVWVACNDPGVAGDGTDGNTGTGTTGAADSTHGGQDGPSSTTSPATTSGVADTSGGGTSSGVGSSSSEGGGESSSTGDPPDTFAECFDGQFVNEATILPDYDQFMPVIGSHCVGTNHQLIDDVERVVFLGDSITVGSRPTLPQQTYRAQLGDMLRDQYSLSYGDAVAEFLWKAPDPFSGQAAQMTAGDFTSCARWGARTDDLNGMGNQLEACFPADTLGLRTLVVMTMGGNDVSSLAQDAIAGVALPELTATVEEFVGLEREAVEWLKEPGRFPNGVFVVFANIYEFTDGTGDVMSCDVSGLAGFDQPVPNPAELTDLILWANEQYMSIAVDTQSDMLFLLETFCGHGFGNEDPASPCYRGPGTPRWFDLTCIHPNPEGHGVIADNFMSIVTE